MVLSLYGKSVCLSAAGLDGFRRLLLMFTKIQVSEPSPVSMEAARRGTGTSSVATYVQYSISEWQHFGRSPYNQK